MKYCPRCGQNKPLGSFGTYEDSRRGRMVQGYCKPCMGDAKTEKTRERVEWLRDLVRRSKCLRCGETDYRVLRFHHRDPAHKLCNVYKAGNAFTQRSLSATSFAPIVMRESTATGREGRMP